MDFHSLKGKCSACVGERDVGLGFKLVMAVTEGRVRGIKKSWREQQRFSVTSADNMLSGL